jgi:hypothetical protein
MALIRIRENTKLGIFSMRQKETKSLQSFGIVTSGNASSFWTEEIRGEF